MFLTRASKSPAPTAWQTSAAIRIVRSMRPAMIQAAASATKAAAAAATRRAMPPKGNRARSASTRMAPTVAASASFNLEREEPLLVGKSIAGQERREMRVGGLHALQIGRAPSRERLGKYV